VLLLAQHHANYKHAYEVNPQTVSRNPSLLALHSSLPPDTGQR